MTRRPSPNPVLRPANTSRDAIAGQIPALRAFAMSLSRNATEADDLVQEALLKGWANFDKFDPGTDLRAWLFTILRNTFYSMQRKRRREVPDPEGVLAGQLAERPAHDGRLAFGEFLRAFDALSPEHREVLILVGANGYSYEEAAGVMGVAIGTAKSRANRARARLAQLLGLQQGEDPLAGETATTLAVLGQSGTRAA